MRLPERNERGELPAFAWPGGYPLVYLDHKDNVLCWECATTSTGDEAAVCGDVHWEGDSLWCDNCGAEIESAYGPVEE